MPRLIDARLNITHLFGQLGPELHVTGHHTAGPKDKSTEHALQLCRSYNEQHKNQGWGGIGYHVCITRKGRILLLRSTVSKGAHVGGHNSNNLGIMFHGTTGDKPTIRQRRALKWYLAHAHTQRLPRKYRTDRDLRRARRFGHRDWAGHAGNACPGTHYRLIKSGGTAR